MQKISNEKKLAVLAEVPGVLRQLVSERDMLRQKLAEYTRKDEATKLARSLIDKGIEDGKVEDLAETLSKKASEGKISLQRLQDAADLVGPDMGSRIDISDDRPSGGSSALESYLLS